MEAAFLFSFASNLYDDQNYHMRIRYACLAYLSQHKAYCRHFVDDSKQSWSHYIVLLHDPAVWADHVCVIATASAYNVITDITKSSPTFNMTLNEIRAENVQRLTDNKDKSNKERDCNRKYQQRRRSNASIRLRDNAKRKEKYKNDANYRSRLNERC